MKINASINKKLYHLFIKNFKKDLIYYNKNGVLYYIINNYPLNDCDSHQTRDISSYFIKDFIDNLKKYNERLSISFEVNPDDVFHFNRIKKTFWKVNEESFIEEESGLKESNSVIINYMMFHLLALNGIIELKEIEDSININEPIIDRINDLENYDDLEKIILE